MCKPKPGPRCSGHALARLERARDADVSRRTNQTKAALMRAQDDYDATPDGISNLGQTVSGLVLEKLPRAAAEVEGRMDAAITRRAAQVEAYRQVTGQTTLGDEPGDGEQDDLKPLAEASPSDGAGPAAGSADAPEDPATALPALPTGELTGIKLGQEKTPLYSIVYRSSEGMLRTDAPYQRGNVWGEHRQRLLIASIQRGIPVGGLYLNTRSQVRDDDIVDESYVVDGKQRLTAVVSFAEGRLTVPAEWFPAADRTGVTETVDGIEHLRFTTGLNVPAQRSWKMDKSITVFASNLPDEAAEAELFGLLNSGGVAQGDTDVSPASGLSR